jgi:hypothetical protein
MLLCGPNAEQLWKDDLQLRIGWAHRCVTAVNVGLSPAPYLALGIHLCEAAKTHVGDLLRSTVRAIDDDLFVSDKKARVTVSKNLAWSVAGRGARGLDMTVQVKGKGGRISAGLPMVLGDGIYMMPKEVMDILSGERALKEIHRARSRKEVLDLLRRSDSAITVRIELSPQLSIADEDLAAYRARLDVGLRWARGCFPELRAGVRLVAE